MGIVIGRIGDLIIGDHLGKPTDFALGWRCLGEVGGEPPTPAETYLAALERGTPPSLGCFDLKLHQTAIYDFFSTLLLLGVLLWLGRRAHRTGFMILVFTIWYSAMRVVTDFLRVDRRYFGLTGSQLMTIAVGLTCLALLARYRGAPPRFAPAPSEGEAALPETGAEGDAAQENTARGQREAAAPPSDHAP